MQGEEFFRCGGHNANRCGIIQAHKGEQAFGIGLVAVAVDDNDLAAFFGDLVKTLALGKAADAGGKFVCCAHHAASRLVFLGLRLFVWIFCITNRNHSFSISTYRVVCYNG